MEKKIMTGIFSAAHFFVDLACSFLMFRFIYSSHSDAELILIYNFCAFALQMPIGIIIDRFGKGHAAAAGGCLLIAAAYAVSIMHIPMLLPAVMAGVGNSLFHVGGGVYVLDNYNDSGALGVFVSPGAVGLYLGTLWGGGENVSAALPVVMLIVFAAAIIIFSGRLSDEQRWGAVSSVFHEEKKDIRLMAAAVLFFAVVVIRSMGGFMTHFSWKTGMAAFAAVICTAGGKALGGFASDKFGMDRASAVSLIAAAVLYILSDNMAAGIAAILLFNMTMPMTLRAAADIFKGGRGFSFGLLTFALFIGYIPHYITGGSILIDGSMMAVLCLASMVMLSGGIILMRGDRK